MEHKLLRKRSRIVFTILIALLIGSISIGLCGCQESAESVNIVEEPSKALQLVDYDSNNFSMKIPEGWTVETGGYDMYYAIRVYNPEDNRYQIFAIIKADPFIKNQQAKNWFENYYNSFGGEGNRMLAEAVVLYKPSVKAFYSSFNDYTKFCKSVEPAYANFNFPNLRNFATVESFNSNTALKNIARDDKTLRGTFQTADGKNGEGLFMASIVEPTSYSPMGFDVTFYSAYNVMGITTPECELVNYQELLTESLASLQYKDSFVNTTINNGQERTQTALSINQSMQAAYDSYNSAWSARQTTYDITSQKNSDATLGYERVYDTETDEIYKAYNGFTDDYTGERYKPITDDMYTQAVDGYIEKR